MGCRLTIRARTLFSGKHFKCPVILFDYPANIKAFYMRLNEDGKQFAPWTFFSLGWRNCGRITEERFDVLVEK
jgi:asparaginyl-tRNA synthetase